MSTEWRFCAFDQQAFERHVAGPLLQAVEKRDRESWLRVLHKLSNVYPPSRLTRFGFNGSAQPITAVEWHAGFAALPLDDPPPTGSPSVDALLKLALEALAASTLVGRCPRPSAVLAELRASDHLQEAEREDLLHLSETLLNWKGTPPTGYEFAYRMNQQAAVVLGAGVAALAQWEQEVGVLRRLGRDLAEGEWRDLGADLATLRSFLSLAGEQGWAIYYREDAT